MRKLQRAEVNIGSLKNGFQQMKAMLFEYRTQIDNKQQHTQDVDRHIEEYRLQEAEIQAKVKALEEKQASVAQDVFSQADSEKLVAVNKMIDEVSHKMAAQEGEKTQTAEQIKAKRAILNEKYIKKQNDI